MPNGEIIKGTKLAGADLSALRRAELRADHASREKKDRYGLLPLKWQIPASGRVVDATKTGQLKKQNNEQFR